MVFGVLLRRLSWHFSLKLQLDMHFHGFLWNDLIFLGLDVQLFVLLFLLPLSIGFSGSNRVLRVLSFLAPTFSSSLKLILLILIFKTDFEYFIEILMLWIQLLMIRFIAYKPISICDLKQGQHIANKQNVNTFTKLCEKSVKLLKLLRHNCQTETANYSILKNTVSRWFKKIKLYRH